MAKTRPASRMPRRLPKARIITKAMLIATGTHDWLAESRRGRDDGVGTGRHGHGDGDGVADQQRGAGDLRDVRAEVVPADHVGAAGLGVGAHDVPVTDRHDGEHPEDRRRHGRDDGEGRQTGDGHQNAQHLLGGVGRGGHDVGRQDGERRRLAQSLAVQVVADQRRAQEHALDAVATALGQVGGDRGVGPGGRPSEVVDRLLAVWTLCGRRAGHRYGLVPVPGRGELRPGAPTEKCTSVRSSEASQSAAASWGSRARPRGPRHPGWTEEPEQVRRADVLAGAHRRRGGRAQDGKCAAGRRLPQQGAGRPSELASQTAVPEGSAAPRQVAARPPRMRGQGERLQSGRLQAAIRARL